MNICLVCNEFPPYKCGGIGIFTKELANALVSNGHEVTVIGIYKDVEEDIVIDNIRIIRIKSLSGKFAFYSNSKLLGNRIKKLIQSEKIDLVETIDFEGVSAFWPTLDVPIVIRLHGSVTYFAYEMGTRVSKLTKFIEGRALKKSDYICSVSNYTANQTKEIFQLNKQITTIYNGVQIPDESKCKKDFTKTYQVAFSGSLMRKKGVLSLAKAWNLVKKEIPQAKLVLVGKDTIENGKSVKEMIYEIIEDRYHDSIEFKGHVPKNIMEKYLVKSDIAAYPSYAEAFSLAPLEAMALAVPTIYSNRTSGFELGNKVDTLEIIDPDNIEQFSQSIIALLSDDDNSAIGKSNRNAIIQKFNADIKLIENINYYERCKNDYRK